MYTFLTRRTRGIGWGYAYHPQRPTAPDYTGTIRTVLREIENNRPYQAACESGRQIHTQWFFNGWPIEWDSAQFMLEIQPLLGHTVDEIDLPLAPARHA